MNTRVPPQMKEMWLILFCLILFTWAVGAFFPHRDGRILLMYILAVISAILLPALYTLVSGKATLPFARSGLIWGSVPLALPFLLFFLRALEVLQHPPANALPSWREFGEPIPWDFLAAAKSIFYPEILLYQFVPPMAVGLLCMCVPSSPWPKVATVFSCLAYPCVLALMLTLARFGT